MKLGHREGFGYCMLTMILFVLLTIFLTVNLLNLGINGKINHRRSLNEKILPILMDRPNLTVIDLGKMASGVFVPEKSSSDEDQISHEIIVRDVADPSEVLNIGFILCKGNITNFETIENLFISSVKSILTFSNHPIIFRIVSNDIEWVNELILEKIAEPNKSNNFWFDVRNDETPDSLEPLKRHLKFKGCGHLKVTFHHTFSDVENLLLLDADTILLRPVEDLFAEMKNFGSNAVMAMAEEHPWNEQGYYSHRPYAHNPAGLNGGLLLYNFTRLSADEFNSPTNDLLSKSFEDALVDSIAYHLLPRKQFLADQCALNALFHHNEDKMHLLPCQWNLRSWSMVECLGDKNCYCPGLDEAGGCALLHGQGRSFVPYKRNVGFFTVWKTFLDLDWADVQSGNTTKVIQVIRDNLANITPEARALDESGLPVLEKCI